MPTRQSAVPLVRRALPLILAGLLAISLAPLAASPTAGADLEPLTSGQLSRRMSGEVFGYLPYWSIASWTEDYLPYDQLTDIAFFGVGIKKNGNLDTDSPGYLDLMSDRGTRIIQRAHARGVRVHITFQSFGGDRNRVLFADPTALATFRGVVVPSPGGGAAPESWNMPPSLTKPGDTTETPTPCGWRSSRRAKVKPRSPNLVAE